jgi:hypothetical protein
MYARVLLVVALGLLIFAGEQRVLLAQSMLGVPGFQQQQQQQQEHPCQAEFNKLRDAIQSRGQALQEAGKRKASAKELCSRIVSYSNAETNMLNFLSKRAQECGIPAEAAEGLKQNRTKTAELRTRVCGAANNPGPAPKSPSAGLSGAINPNAGVVPEVPSGGGIFDTLSGNVLQQ